MKLPTVTADRKGEPFLRNGQLKMYANNVLFSETDREGAAVDIVNEDGEYIATGYLSPKSHIRVRILSHRQGEPLDGAFFRKRFRRALAYRRTVCEGNTDNCRLVFSDADGIPGFICDRYNDLLVTQISTPGLEKNRDMIYEALLAVLSEEGTLIRGIYERNDISVRTKEGLPLYTGFYGDRDLETETVISENGIKIRVDIAEGQKTGYFLDQKSNRLLVRGIAHGKRVLDCFSHTGGFALNAAYGNAAHVTAVDVSKPALDQGYANAVLNGLEERISFVQADVFEYLDALKQGIYDLIILDPPAFTKSRRTAKRAYNGYKHINRRAMELLKNGGYLATCSCSRYMETALFEDMLRESAEEAGVLLRQASVTQQNADHPIVWGTDDTSYLKFYIFQILPKGDTV